MGGLGICCDGWLFSFCLRLRNGPGQLHELLRRYGWWTGRVWALEGIVFWCEKEGWLKLYSCCFLSAFALLNIFPVDIIGGV